MIQSSAYSAIILSGKKLAGIVFTNEQSRDLNSRSHVIFED